MEVKKQNGLILFPHPFQSHPNDKIELIASDADLIEISNSRCTKIQDKKSESLSYKFNKLPIMEVMPIFQMNYVM